MHIVIFNIFVIEKWVNCRNFLVHEKNLQKSDLAAELISV